MPNFPKCRTVYHFHSAGIMQEVASAAIAELTREIYDMEGAAHITLWVLMAQRSAVRAMDFEDLIGRLPGHTADHDICSQEDWSEAVVRTASVLQILWGQGTWQRLWDTLEASGCYLEASLVLATAGEAVRCEAASYHLLDGTHQIISAVLEHGDEDAQRVIRNVVLSRMSVLEAREHYAP